LHGLKQNIKDNARTKNIFFTRLKPRNGIFAGTKILYKPFIYNKIYCGRFLLSFSNHWETQAAAWSGRKAVLYVKEGIQDIYINMKTRLPVIIFFKHCWCFSVILIFFCRQLMRSIKLHQYHLVQMFQHKYLWVSIECFFCSIF
jgi:hypothetical protein